MIEIYDRTSYSVFVFDIPHLKGRELKEAVRFKLVGMYPEKPDDKNIFIEKNGNRKWSYLVIVLNCMENRMLPLSILFLRNFFSKKNGKTVYLEDDWIEFSVIEDGGVLKSTVKKRNDEKTFEYMEECFGPDPDRVEVFCHEKDYAVFGKKQDDRKYIFHSIKNELKNTDVYTISLNRNLSPAIKRRRIVSATVGVLIVAGSAIFIHQYRILENEKQTRLQMEQANSERLREERRKEEQRLTELQAQYHELTAQKTPTPFEMSIVISECLEANTRILSTTFNQGFFQINGTTGNSLALLRNFEKHGQSAGMRLHQVHPVNNRDTFTLSGTIVPYIEQVSQGLDLKEQIIKLQALIEREQNNLEDSNSGPSEFGDTVKSLLKKWGCPVTGFQFLSGGDTVEIEYTIRGTSYSFFNFLNEASRHPAWEIPLVQIRNLYPQNSMDVVFRIKTESKYPENRTAAAEAVRVPEPFPMDRITRNYYSYSRPVQPTTADRPLPEVARPIVFPPEKAERALWLEYIGMISDNSGEPMAYVKDTRTGEILKLSVSENNNMRYIIVDSGNIQAYINGRLYEISKK